MGVRRTSLIFGALAIWLLALALVRPLSVDESQYVAATSLTAHGLLPYRDFAYLQTPLQPLAFTPLGWLFTGHLMLAMRIANALLGSATVILVYGAARRMGACGRASLVAAAMLVACESFAWSVGVARNDMLPAALMAVGLFVAARAGSGWRMFVCGLALGVAAGVKISYAVPAGTVFLAEAWARERRALWFAGGVVAGLAPSLIVIALAPNAFIAEAIMFPATAPAQYYSEIGKSWRLGPMRFVQLLEAAAVGPALIAVIEVAGRGWKERWFDNPARRTMLAAALGGLISALLNKPFQIFYLLPALPPLFALVSLMFSERRPLWLTGAWTLFVVIGLVPVAGWVLRAANSGVAPAIDADRRSQALAVALHDLHAEGPVATLAGQYVARVDPRFAAGPFLYRARGFASIEQARQWHFVIGDQATLLAEEPPAAIVTGSYPDAQPELEAELAAQARGLGYRPVEAAAGFTVWVRQP